MCLESEWVTADMIDMLEYPDLARTYNLDSVPVTIVNERGQVEGGLPEELFVPMVLNPPAPNPNKPKRRDP